MWDTVLDPSFEAQIQEREESLKVRFRNTTVKRFLNNSISAWSIVDNVVKENDQREVHSRKKKYSLRSLVLMILGSLSYSKNQVRKIHRLEGITINHRFSQEIGTSRVYDACCS